MCVFRSIKVCSRSLSIGIFSDDGDLYVVATYSCIWLLPFFAGLLPQCANLYIHFSFHECLLCARHRRWKMNETQSVLSGSSQSSRCV